LTDEPARRIASPREELAHLAEGCVDLIQPAELEAKLERSRKTGKPLKVKVGFDPTAPDIHIGHTVLMRKMRALQDLGHEVYFVVGDFTARIGDPTGRSKTRPPLSPDEIAANAETYTSQAFKILDRERTRVVFNGEWLDELRSSEWIKLAAQYNVARMLERRDFRQRFDSGQSISLHEFLYPLAQAYDSVHLKADMELGGTDQLFNLNVGRDVMPGYGLEPQVVMTTPLLEGLDGVEKMSKSAGNYVGITEPPLEMFGKLMSISDALMWRYWALLTDLSGDEVETLKKKASTGSRHPKELKAELARRVIASFHPAGEAEKAEAEWQRIFAKGEVPAEVPELRRPCAKEPVWIPKLLVEAGLAKSTSEVLRTIRQGGMQVDGDRIEETEASLDASRPGSRLLRFGKRRFLRLVLE
jgi:tyrosyl-tRNA synthetase